MLEGKSQCPFCFANVGVPALTVREAFGLTGDDEGTSERARRLQERDNGVFVLDDVLTPEHLPVLVEEKFPKENFRVNREMRDEILVYDLFLTKI
jgi:hypothetical protein